jgi:hypothetical protein
VKTAWLLSENAIPVVNQASFIMAAGACLLQVLQPTTLQTAKIFCRAEPPTASPAAPSRLPCVPSRWPAIPTAARVSYRQLRNGSEMRTERRSSLALKAEVTLP